MKQFYQLLVLVLLTVLNADAQAPRRVLVEDFTQASCGPCAVYNPIYHGILFAPGNENKLTLLCYQTSWPGTDPMNSQNPTEVASRVTYNGVAYVPYSVVDGGKTVAGDSLFHDNIAVFKQTVIDNRRIETSPIELSVDHNLKVKLDSVTITVNVKNVSANDLLDIYTLQTVLIEKTIKFPTAPGSNGETEFFSVMRKMIPNASGTKMGVLAAGASKNFTFTIVMPTYIYSLENLGAVAFVQNTSKKEVLQSAESYPKPLPNGSTFLDLKANGEALGYTGLCDPGVTFKVNFINNGTDSIKTISVDLLLNGIKQGSTRIDTVNLPAGASDSYEFKNINLKAGKNGLNYRINLINGVNNKDIDKLNHLGIAQNLYNVATAPYATEMNQDFEVSARGVLPANLHLDDNGSGMRVFPADKAWVLGVDEIGGFGNSLLSLWWDFYFGNPDSEVKIFYNKLDLSNSTNTHLSLSRAYAQLNNENARFTIEASKDCGANWTIVYEKTGFDLTTVPDPIPFNYWAPLASDWIRDTVSMTDFDGAPEVLVQLRGYNSPQTSNFLYIDDINIASLATATDNPGILTSMSVYPNPTNDVINVNVNTQEVIQASFIMYDLNGKAVGVLGQNMDLRSGVNVKSFKVDNYNPGLYTLKILTEKGVRNTMVSIH